MSYRQFWPNGDHLSSAKSIVVFLLILLLVGQSGCATSKPYTPPMPHDLPLSGEVREKMGIVGVTSACFLPRAELCKPMGKWAGAATGAAGGFLKCLFAGSALGVRAFAASAQPYVLLLGIALAPVGAVAGGIAGAEQGVSSEQMKGAEEAINKALSELKIEATMRDYVLRVALEKTGNHLIPLNVKGPDAPDREVDYRFLSHEGIDTVLELSIPVFGLIEEKKEINPPLIFFMSLHTRLVRTSDGKVLHTQDLEYRSAERKFIDWASDSAKLYREEFTLCYQNLAERVVNRIFLSCNLPVEAVPQSGSDGEDKKNHLK